MKGEGRQYMRTLCVRFFFFFSGKPKTALKTEVYS